MSDVWILYRRPIDFEDAELWPAPFVARRWSIVAGKPAATDDLVKANSIDELRTLLPFGLEVLTRSLEDDAEIVETRIKPQDPFDLGVDDDGRMLGGMRVSEAAARAARWWNRIGRHSIKKSFNTEKDAARVLAPGRSSGLLIPGEVRDVVPSGILRGLPWDMLTTTEQRRVVKVWHFEKVQRAQKPTWRV